MIQVVRVPAEAQVVTHAKEFTRLYAKKCKQVSREEKESSLGLPHVHVWNSMVKDLLAHATAKKMEKEVQAINTDFEAFM
eukprot:4076564-Alexandrium_andersonii.AAC.1